MKQFHTKSQCHAVQGYGNNIQDYLNVSRYFMPNYILLGLKLKEASRILVCLTYLVRFKSYSGMKMLKRQKIWILMMSLKLKTPRLVSCKSYYVVYGRADHLSL